MQPIASKRFDWPEQRRFAQLSGDSNPMHMDPVAARRTSAGAPVVHGVHLLAWAISQLAAHCGGKPVGRVKTTWSHFVYVGDEAGLTIESATESRLRAQIHVGGDPAATLTLFLGLTRAAEPPQAAAGSALLSPAAPLNYRLEELAEQSGALTLPVTAAQVATEFPSAAAGIGQRPLAGLLALSRLVGMICPGLHSIFAQLDVAFDERIGGDFVAYHVAQVDERFRYVTQLVRGFGLAGTVEAFARPEPVQQPGADELAAPDAQELRGAVALVIGGSRGLGEVAAKLLAAAGARVVISYSLGRDDADRVAASIRDAGGLCDVIQCDVRRASPHPLESLDPPPTHVYYFATGPISPSRAKVFDERRFGDFCAFYVHGFARLCASLGKPAQGAVRVFYPSSVYVSPDAGRPEGLAEYAVAKAAGEALCAEIERRIPHLEILSRRLPRMKTDQTAAVFPDESYTPVVDVIREVIRDMHAPPAAGA